ncbi:MAG TPA: 3-phosphoserine/phosphohydroxythreonine transaminase [Thermoanaerobaculia bacterium]|nr:3-phosphoserine/phosphohydroxythreonine transaminase [Thermoanaerobaculia bacterium]
MSERVFNFSAGPAAIPLPVLERVRDEMLSLPGAGMSVLEISHRSKWFDAILGEAVENLRRILAVPQDYHVVFLQGGAQLQFDMVPINFLAADRSADYVLTGSWGAKALAEARISGGARVAWDGKLDRYVRVPQSSELDLDPDARYVHFTSNETIQGVQFRNPPETGTVPLVCDASSDFLSRPVDVSRFGLIYACAQKNAGPAGMTVVILHDDLLAKRRDGLHSMLDYRCHVEGGSRFNTSPVFPIYVFGLITRWIEGEMGGLAALARANEEKAKLLYDALDEHADFYAAHAERDSRSVMNVTFRLPSEELDQEFLAGAAERGMAQLKGHRSVGGARASIYNAMPRAGVEALRDWMVEFREARM